MTPFRRALLCAASITATSLVFGASQAQTAQSPQTQAPQPGVQTPTDPGVNAPAADHGTSNSQPDVGNAGQNAEAKSNKPGETPNAVSEVVVTGYRKSLETALTAKRLAPNIQEDLSAEDIGKLPDVSIGEALARLPGLATNRDRGNATQISIRGLPPELGNTLLNGREVVTAEPDRNIRFEQYPAELITGASVYKSPTAEQVEGAIAGQIDLRTIKPLDYSTSQIVLNGRGSYNDLAPSVTDGHPDGWIGSASYVGQFANHTLGVAIGVAGRDEPVTTERTNIYRYTNSYTNLATGGSGSDDVPYGFEALQRGGDDRRAAAVATVQWAPNTHFSLNTDFFYSNTNYTEIQRGFSAQDLPFGNTFSNTTVQDGGATSGTATNFANYGLQAESNNQLYRFTDILYAGGINAAWKGERWRAVADIGYSNTSRHALFLNLYTEAVNPDGSTNFNGVSASYATNPGSPSSFGFSQSLTDPTLNHLTNLEIPTNGNGAPIINDELYSGKFDLQFDLENAWFKTLDAGFRSTSRDKSLVQRTQYDSVTNLTTIPANLLLSPIKWRGAFSGLPQSIGLDVLGVTDQIFGGLDPTESTDDERASWNVGEKTYAGYVQTDFEHDVFGMRLEGNAGVRIIRTEETSSSTSIADTPTTNGEVGTPVTYHNNFTNVLPELNLTLHVTDKQQFRFAVSEAVARAPLDYLNAGFAVYATGGAPSEYGGNPLLKPYKADQVDLTFENYFNKDTALTVSLFYKKLDTYIVQQIDDVTINVDGVAEAGTFQHPVNGTGGRVDGIEVLYQQAFTFLPHPFDGFGIYANGSYTDSSVQVSEGDNSIGNVALPGLSKVVYNLSGYYSKAGFETRLAFRYRSTFATQTGDTDRILYNHGEGVLDYEASYDFPSTSRLAGLRVMVQANNLNNEPYILYYKTTAQQGRYETFGRRYWAGLTYKFGL